MKLSSLWFRNRAARDFQAIQEAKRSLFQPDWKKVFDRDAVMESIRKITRPAV